MKKIIIDPVKVDGLIGKKPIPNKNTLINFEAEIYNKAGELLLAYYKAPEPIYLLAKEVALNTKPTSSKRTRHGVKQLSTVYGALPRNPIREDYCRYSKKSKQEKGNYQKALKLNRMIAQFYKEKYPILHGTAINKVKEVVDNSYRIVDTPWATININLNQVIKYHRDKGNFKEDLSNIIIVKNKVEGGYLDFPELKVKIAQSDGYLAFFKGQDLLHGVTDCKFTSSESYRCSIVNYTMAQMKHCYPYTQELVRVKEVKTNQAINKLQSLEELKGYLVKKKGE